MYRSDYDHVGIKFYFIHTHLSINTSQHNLLWPKRSAHTFKDNNTYIPFIMHFSQKLLSTEAQPVFYHPILIILIIIWSLSGHLEPFSQEIYCCQIKLIFHNIWPGFKELPYHSWYQSINNKRYMTAQIPCIWLL